MVQNRRLGQTSRANDVIHIHEPRVCEVNHGRASGSKWASPALTHSPPTQRVQSDLVVAPGVGEHVLGTLGVVPLLAARPRLQAQDLEHGLVERSLVLLNGLHPSSLVEQMVKEKNSARGVSQQDDTVVQRLGPSEISHCNVRGWPPVSIGSPGTQHGRDGDVPTLGHDELIWVDHQQGTIKRQMAACCKPPHPIRCPLVWGTDLGIIGLQHECEPVPPSVATPEVNEGLVHMQHRRSGCDENSDLVGNISPTLAALQAQRTRPSRQNDLLQLPPPLRCTFRFADINEESQLEQRALQPMQL
mmetsp:Transcript_177416/g.568929  ORF Transcript_177416/g.568929 Transcript_177416/m.568929 type:complete len:302 (-) Transcript_177416:499-1404(-)